MKETWICVVRGTSESGAKNQRKIGRVHFSIFSQQGQSAGGKITHGSSIEQWWQVELLKCIHDVAVDIVKNLIVTYMTTRDCKNMHIMLEGFIFFAEIPILKEKTHQGYTYIVYDKNNHKKIVYIV